MWREREREIRREMKLKAMLERKAKIVAGEIKEGPII